MSKEIMESKKLAEMYQIQRIAAKNETLATSVGTWLCHFIFLGQLLMFFVPRQNSAGIGDWMSSVAAGLLTVVGAYQTYSKWILFPLALRNWIMVAGALSGYAIIRGFGDEDFLKSLLESLPFLAIVFFPAIGFPTIPDSLIRAFTIHAIVGVMACGIVLVVNRGVITADVVQRSETLELKSVQFTLYSLFFVFFRIMEVPFAVRIAVVVGLIEMAVFAVSSGTRQAIALLAGVICIGLWNVLRTSGSSDFGSQLAAVSAGRKFLILAFVVAMLAVGGYQISANLNGGMALLESRLTTDRRGTSIWENDRWDEILQLLEQFTVDDHLFGRGVRGSFENDAAPNNDNVHIGWFRVLLKSGLIMIFLLVVGPVVTGGMSLLHSRDPTVLAAAGMCCYFAVKNSTGNIVMPYPVFYMVMICFGSCAYRSWSQGRGYYFFN